MPVVTPIKSISTLDLENLSLLLGFYSARRHACALLLGTTGEGPSFSSQERLEILQTAAWAREKLPGFRLLAGTGTPSLEETIANTKTAFNLGVDGVVVLPPYYYRKATDEGLFSWFSHVLQRGVPQGSALFGYHIPSVSGVGFSLTLLQRLKQAFPDRFAGLKDSSSDPEFARQLGDTFGGELLVFNGNDRILPFALSCHAGGCITAMANVCSPDSPVWDAFQVNDTDEAAHQRLDFRCRDVMAATHLLHTSQSSAGACMNSPVDSTHHLEPPRSDQQSGCE
jgi:4-hydroxy-tetrahydrodipicolinate synthase